MKKLGILMMIIFVIGLFYITSMQDGYIFALKLWGISIATTAFFGLSLWLIIYKK